MAWASKLFNKTKNVQRNSCSDSDVVLSAADEISASAEISDETELIAVISAALQAFVGDSGNTLIVKSFRRIQSSSPAWNAAALAEQMN